MRKEPVILRKFLRYGALTYIQLGRALFQKSVRYTYASEIANELLKKGLLIQQPIQPVYLRDTDRMIGGNQKLYALSAQGVKALRALGHTIEWYFQPNDLDRRRLWDHFVLMNDLLISAEWWEKENPSVKLLSIKNEAWVNRMKEFKGKPVIPDGLLELLINDERRFCLLFELERDNYEEERVRQKIEKRIAFAEGQFQEIFGVDFMPIYPILATRGEAHRKQLLKWMHIKLREMSREEYSVLFWVTEHDPADKAIFTDPVWHLPGNYNGPYRFLQDIG